MTGFNDSSLIIQPPLFLVNGIVGNTGPFRLINMNFPDTTMRICLRNGISSDFYC